jgi:exopolysaccharide biosynthesis polyprenyl glycosylphosphotransferase
MSTNAASAEVGGSLSVSTDVLTEALIPVAPATGRRQSLLRRQLLSADILAGSATGVMAIVMAGLDYDKLPIVVLLLGAGWPLLAYVCGLYAVDDLRAWASGVGDAPRLAVASLLISWPIFGLLNALDAPSPVLGALSAAGVAAAAAGVSRAAARFNLHRTPSLRQRTLVLGSGVVATDLVARLHRHPELGLDPVGFIDDDVHQATELAVPRLGTLDSLQELIDDGRVDRVIIAFTRAPHEQLLHCIRVCREAGITVDIVPRLFEFLDGARTIQQIGSLPLLSIRVPAMSPLSRFSKRALDLVVASLAILVLAPLLAVIAAAIRLDSRGPIFYAQTRPGRGGRPFRLYKFRSMRPGTDVVLDDSGALAKAAGDPRITRVGRFIRRFSLDEAPQLLNVLKGDMSLVGPRPLLSEEHAALTEQWHERRADLRPGLTGPWQVSGRSQLGLHERMRLDYQYVSGWSLARDMEILLATLPAVLSGRGAY